MSQGRQRFQLIGFCCETHSCEQIGLHGHFKKNHERWHFSVQAEIVEIAKTFLPGKTTGYDQIPMSVIKESILFVSEPLIHIINLSIEHGIVPDEMKIARVIPIFKSDDQSLFTNYRPVSLLPSF